MVRHDGMKYDCLVTSGPSSWGAGKHPLTRKLNVYKKISFNCGLYAFWALQRKLLCRNGAFWLNSKKKYFSGGYALSYLNGKVRVCLVVVVVVFTLLKQRLLGW